MAVTSLAWSSNFEQNYANFTNQVVFLLQGNFSFTFFIYLNHGCASGCQQRLSLRSVCIISIQINLGPSYLSNFLFYISPLYLLLSPSISVSYWSLRNISLNEEFHQCSSVKPVVQEVVSVLMVPSPVPVRIPW